MLIGIDDPTLATARQREDTLRMPEDPQPIRLPAQPSIPREPYTSARHDEPSVVDADIDLFGAEAAAATLTERLMSAAPAEVRYGDDGRAVLSPPFESGRERVDGYPDAATTLVVFGAFGTPWSKRLGTLLREVRDRYPATVRVAWRHYPDPAAHPHAVVLALASEVAAIHGRFWALTRALLSAAHSDPADLHAALIHAGLDPERTIAEMRVGTGADHIAADVASAHASGVIASPALFIDGIRYEGELTDSAVSGALDAGA
jgi:protein-disulfide isomerase